MKADELDEAAEILAELTAPMFQERVPGIAFWGFYAKEQGSDLEDDEVLERFAKHRGVYAVELVWDDDLDLKQRGEGRVVRTLDELRACLRRQRDLSDGMERTRQNLAAAPAPSAATSAGPSSWLAARTKR